MNKQAMYLILGIIFIVIGTISIIISLPFFMNFARLYPDIEEKAEYAEEIYGYLISGIVCLIVGIIIFIVGTILLYKNYLSKKE